MHQRGPRCFGVFTSSLNGQVGGATAEILTNKEQERLKEQNK